MVELVTRLVVLAANACWPKKRATKRETDFMSAKN